MSRTSSVAALALAALALAGCGPSVVQLSLTDANNYSLGGTVTLPNYQTVSGADVTFDWAALRDDLQCHDVDPAADIDTAALVRFGRLSHADIEVGLANNTLQQADSDGYVEVYTEGGTTTSLESMSFFGTPIDVPSEYYDGGGSYMFVLTTGTTPGVGARMLAFLEPSTESTTTEVAIEDGCGMLDLTIDLQSLQPLVAEDAKSWEVDWSGLTTDGQGNDFQAAGVDEMNIAFYEGMSSATLESQFLDLEELATKMWTLPLNGGTTAKLELAYAGTEPFAGFEGEGLWVLALRCTRCYNPAPLFFSVFDTSGV